MNLMVQNRCQPLIVVQAQRCDQVVQRNHHFFGILQLRSAPASLTRTMKDDATSSQLHGRGPDAMPARLGSTPNSPGARLALSSLCGCFK